MAILLTQLWPTLVVHGGRNRASFTRLASFDTAYRSEYDGIRLVVVSYHLQMHSLFFVPQNQIQQTLTIFLLGICCIFNLSCIGNAGL